MVWLPQEGRGFYPVRQEDMPYDREYFEKYRRQADTPIGHALTEARVQMVLRHWDGPVLDVGIGCGQFVLAHPQAHGFDVNPAGVAWLKEGGIWDDLYGRQYPALTFWDSLEHIFDIEKAVSHADEWVFVSLPIFDNSEHCLRSKHFRPNEHVWYFTDTGLKDWFAKQGFACVEQNNLETLIGREGIGSYAFRRV